MQISFEHYLLLSIVTILFIGFLYKSIVLILKAIRGTTHTYILTIFDLAISTFLTVALAYYLTTEICKINH